MPPAIADTPEAPSSVPGVRRLEVPLHLGDEARPRSSSTTTVMPGLVQNWPAPIAHESNSSLAMAAPRSSQRAPAARRPG